MGISDLGEDPNSDILGTGLSGKKGFSIACSPTCVVFKRKAFLVLTDVPLEPGKPLLLNWLPGNLLPYIQCWIYGTCHVFCGHCLGLDGYVKRTCVLSVLSALNMPLVVNK